VPLLNGPHTFALPTIPLPSAVLGSLPNPANVRVRVRPFKSVPSHSLAKCLPIPLPARAFPVSITQLAGGGQEGATPSLSMHIR
jgi:hypothetical protein